MNPGGLPVEALINFGVVALSLAAGGVGSYIAIQVQLTTLRAEMRLQNESRADLVAKVNHLTERIDILFQALGPGSK